MSSAKEAMSHFNMSRLLGPGKGRRLGLLTAITLPILVVLLTLQDSRTVYYSPFLLQTATFLFIIIPCGIMAILFARIYLRQGQPSVLALGGGVVAFGIANVLTSFYSAFGLGANDIVTVHNISTLAFAASCFVSTHQRLQSGSYSQGGAKFSLLALVYTSMLLLPLLVYWASLSGNLPTFFVQGEGPTRIRQLVLTTALVLFVVALKEQYSVYRRIRSVFGYWFLLGLVLIITALICFGLMYAVHTPLSWLGRISQIFGFGFILAGVLATYRDSREGRQSVEDALQSFLSANTGYRLLVENSSDLIARLNLEMRLSYVNPSIERLTGLPASQLLHRTLAEAGLKGETLRRLESTAHKALEEGVEQTAEIAFATRDGSYVHHCRFMPERNDRGRIWGVVLVGRDITQRANLEKELQQAKIKAELRASELDAALDALAEGVVIYGLDEKIKRMNPAAEHLLQYDPRTREADLASRLAMLRASLPGGGLVTSDDASIRRAARGETVRSKELLVYLKGDDQPHFISVNAAPIRMPNDEQIGIIATFIDITERKRIEQALRESEERFRTLADNMSQLAWMADEKGFIFWYNRRWYVYTGTTFEETQGMGWRKVHHPEHVDRVVESASHSISTGEEWEDTFPLRGKDGQYCWFLSRAVPIRDDQGRIVRWFGTNTDITELLEKERQLETALAERDRFFSIIAHDLRSPFMGFLVFIKMLTERVDKLSLNEIQRLSHDMQESAENLHRLLENLLEWALAQRGEIAYEPGRCDLAEMVDRNIEFIKMVALQKDVEFQSEIPEGLSVLVDKHMLDTILRNLFTNAVKFSSNAGKVHVRADSNEDFVTVSVKDNGIGMDEETLSNLLRLDKMRSRKGTGGEKGTGLGLLLCKEFIEKHGGRIWVNSKAGKGTTIYFTLPAYADDQVTDEATLDHERTGPMF
ncbi:PAS domain S-box-containing protein [Desulfonatronum thiosulfatophilum]|uniref:histidine kinase n=1 Tax=Desulfonatronum thiosulfatophilum TaxID=617002 RepID=A0A1G6A9X2_9BACT|nr:PAS domain-containing sensor histidine kinase [Desulfonatronum thiosulfatophilum]SDB05228.1 PAS domain S-box-containing protein [Desulfonatronum thiosulfatophilum]